MKTFKNYIESMGSCLAATWVANTCITMPVISRVVTNQLIYLLGNNNCFVAGLGGISVGFLASVATESLINNYVLFSSKLYGMSIVKEAKVITDKYIPTRLIGFFAFLASIN